MAKREEDEVEIIQIGPVKYSKEEEKIIVKSWIFGMIIGYSVGVVTGLSFGLFPGSMSQDILKILVADASFLGYICFWWWMITLSFLTLLWKKWKT